MVLKKVEMKRKGSELIFLKRINNEGTELKEVSQRMIDTCQDDVFELQCLSMTFGTFIASKMSCFIVKLK